jgi:hypothetical protein
VLCYVDAPWAWFTTQALADQWGDDWNDAPYECNAGTPYTGDGWEVFRVAFDGDFCGPSDGGVWYSVEEINAGAVAWLRSPRYAPSPHVIISAGTTYRAFVCLVQTARGQVYEPVGRVPG